MTSQHVWPEAPARAIVSPPELKEAAVTVATGEPYLPEDRFFDRELSWLAFNQRVLDLARDADRVPLLERARRAV